MRILWMQKAMKCCGGPVLFLSGLYTLLGFLFIMGSFYLDPEMAPVGEILLGVGLMILLMFLILAYSSYRLRQNGADVD